MAAHIISFLLLEQAGLFAQQDDWPRARQVASRALELNPALVDAYLIRGFAARRLGDFDAAFTDYTAVLELDPQHGRAWLERGAVKVLKAYEIDDRVRASATAPGGLKYCPAAVEWLLGALADYQRGAELDPDDDSAGLSLLELEIILDRHKEAVARAAGWWSRIQAPPKRLACAWLAAVAFILAGKKERHWAQFREYLERNPVRPAWEPEQIDGYLARLEKEGRCPPDRLAAAQRSHKLFLSRYTSREEQTP